MLFSYSTGIRSNRFTTKWYAETQPKARYETSEGNAHGKRNFKITTRVVVIFIFIDYLHIVYDHEIIVVGGGLAGLTAALHLAREGKQVLVIEKHQYPRHRVCGEYVSNEVRPYLDKLGIQIEEITSIAINQIQLSNQKGQAITSKLPMGGFGISRYAFDQLLYQKAKALGVDFLFDTAEAINVNSQTPEVITKKEKVLHAKVLLGAFGKRSNLDINLKRNFIKRKSPWLGVKSHYDFSSHPENVVGLHNFPGGYAGISKVEGGRVNFCYLASYESFQNEKDLDAFNQNVVSQNPILGEFLKNASPTFKKPLTIAQISFQKKAPTVGHIPMLGDSAGMIHPLCGNGMAMAIHSAKIASECVLRHCEKPTGPLEALGSAYTKSWQRHFQRRLWVGRQLQHVFLSASLSDLAVNTVARSEKLLQSVIAQTHGEPILN